MPAFVNFAVEFVMSLLVFTLLARWYAWPFLNQKPFPSALLLLLSLSYCDIWVSSHLFQASSIPW
jgi:hypothetical protein